MKNENSEGLQSSELPPSLAVNPNIPFSRQTLEQLLLERDYWQGKLNARGETWGASVSAMLEFITDLNKWVRIRQAEAEKD